MKRLALALLALLALAAVPAGAATQRASLAAIERDVMCVTCGIPLAEAVSPQADEERSFIVRLIRQGDSAVQIKRKLVAQYTAAVLALPPAHGFNVAVYVVPIAVVVVALAVVGVLLPRWRRNRGRGGPGGGGGAALSAADAARLDADMARFDP